MTEIQSSSQSEKRIVLDPTGLYPIPPGYIPITTEVEWIQHFGVSNSCWVTTKRLCDWATEWLRVWNKTETITEIKQDPRIVFTSLFHPIPVPEWTPQQLLTLATKLDFYPPDQQIAHLIAEITNTNLQIWLASPSIPNLADWLLIEIPEEWRVLEQVWQQQFSEHELATYYQTEDKLLLLRRWLGIAEPVVTLGKYPLPIPDFLTQEFDQYWQQQLYHSEGKILENLNPTTQVGMERIATLAYQLSDDRPTWINKATENKLSHYLNSEQRLELRNRQAPVKPQPLEINASPQQALAWVCNNYLPFRRWDVLTNSHQISDSLAGSFVEWMVQNYPLLKIEPVTSSYLNYNVASLVQNLCEEEPVLWVVVDGLGWLDHLELLSYLTKNDQLAVETTIQPRFSILPTKTEYAKWSLYSQLLPNDSSWSMDTGKAFTKMGMGERYTDSRQAELRQDLKQGKHQLYCWDTEQFDKLYHTERDWKHLHKVTRPHTLEGIAKEIISFLEEFKSPSRLRVAIASDHGQMMGVATKISPIPPGLEAKGRMAKGITDDSRFIALDCDRYSLPHDISVVKGSGSLGSFSYTINQTIIGSHGGLFPEEVVIGVSVLRQTVQRRPVFISCRSEGKPGQGELEITIENNNSVPLTDLCLYISELPSFKTGKPLEAKILPNTQESFTTIIDIPELPPNYEGKSYSLSGELTFRYADTEVGRVSLNPESAIIINQIYSSGLDINEFL